MTVLLASLADSADSWSKALLAKELPIPLRIWPDIGDPNEIRYAIVAKPPAGLLAELPNLRAILSLWAGVDHITGDSSHPRDVPIYRMIEPGLTGGMIEFVLSQVLNLHLGNYEVVAAQARREWLRSPRGPYGLEPLLHERPVGVLGLGEMGREAAQALSRLGFPVRGWSRSQKRIEGVACYSGREGLESVVSKSDILVNLLPLTSETEGLLSADLFARMPPGAGLVNVGRGQHVVERDLLDALDSGQVGRAVLDVFDQEPLPDSHPFWSHAKITIYPHIASVTRVRTGVVVLADRLRLLEAGEEPDGLYEPGRGY